MEEKKKISNWRIALIHYLIAGLAISILIKFILSYTIGDIIIDTLYALYFLGAISNLLIFILVFEVFPIWLGVMLSAKYLKKKYIIEDEGSVIKLSTMYLIAFPCIIVISSFVLSPILGEIECAFCNRLFIGVFLSLILSFQMYSVSGILMVFGIMAFIFYIFSKKYISNIKILDSIKNIGSPIKQEKTERKKANWGIILFTGFTFFVVLAVVIIGLELASPSPTRAKDSRIISAIAQARTVMIYINAIVGDYDDFSCTHTDMVTLCSQVANNHPTSGTNPTIVKDAASDSDAACIYSLLNAKSNYWYCTDSEEHMGCTDINPGSPGYCVEGESAICPPLSDCY